MQQSPSNVQCILSDCRRVSIVFSQQYVECVIIRIINRGHNRISKLLAYIRSRADFEKCQIGRDGLGHDRNSAFILKNNEGPRPKGRETAIRYDR